MGVSFKDTTMQRSPITLALRYMNADQIKYLLILIYLHGK